MPVEFLVQLPPDEDIEVLLERLPGARLKSRSHTPGSYVITLPVTPGVDHLAVLRQHAQSVEPNYLLPLQQGGPDLPAQWALHNDGSNGKVEDADINAPQAWATPQPPGPGPVIGIIDGKVDCGHFDLEANIWTNQAEKQGTPGRDDDDNGYVDDVHGFDAFAAVNMGVTEGSIPAGDPCGKGIHGTGVAGIIAAAHNGEGISGVIPHAQLVLCNAADDQEVVSLRAAEECLKYFLALKKNGIEIVVTNNSYGDRVDEPAELKQVIERHRDAGILFVAPVGNERENNDRARFFPASLFLPNVIAVAGTDSADRRARSSDYGARTVHVTAPCDEIVTLYPDPRDPDGLDWKMTTSFAAPHVTGLVALVYAHTRLDWRSIRNLVIAGGTQAHGVNGLSFSDRRIRARDESGASALDCRNQLVRKRLRPVEDTLVRPLSAAPLDVAAIAIECATRLGDTLAVQVDEIRADGSLQPQPPLVLKDDAQSFGQVPGDGIYTEAWKPSAAGKYRLTFPAGFPSTDTLEVEWQ